MLGAGFKPVVRYFVPQVGSTPTGFRQVKPFWLNRLASIDVRDVPVFVPDRQVTPFKSVSSKTQPVDIRGLQIPGGVL